METSKEIKMAKCYLSNNRQVEGPAELVSAYINASQRNRTLKNNLALAVEALRAAGLPNPCVQKQEEPASQPEDEMLF